MWLIVPGMAYWLIFNQYWYLMLREDLALHSQTSLFLKLYRNCFLSLKILYMISVRHCHVEMCIITHIVVNRGWTNWLSWGRARQRYEKKCMTYPLRRKRCDGLLNFPMLNPCQWHNWFAKQLCLLLETSIRFVNDIPIRPPLRETKISSNPSPMMNIGSSLSVWFLSCPRNGVKQFNLGPMSCIRMHGTKLYQKWFPFQTLHAKILASC